MDAMTATAQMTATEFLALEPHDRAARRELVDGELIVSQPTWTHNSAQICIQATLWNWARAAPDRGAAGVPLAVLLDDRNVHCPDVVWYRTGRVPERGDPPPYAVPDLVVEVRSPSTWRYDIGPKKRRYEQHGLPELWLVDTAADEVLVFRRSSPKAAEFDVCLELARGDALTSPQLPGFALALDELFGSPAV
jgi:Uma2 family endonuclease